MHGDYLPAVGEVLEDLEVEVGEEGEEVGGGGGWGGRRGRVGEGWEFLRWWVERGCGFVSARGIGILIGALFIPRVQQAQEIVPSGRPTAHHPLKHLLQHPPLNFLTHIRTYPRNPFSKCLRKHQIFCLNYRIDQYCKSSRQKLYNNVLAFCVFFEF